MFRIKICGMTNVDDAQTAVQAGADALGLNFYAKSPRYVLPQTAHDIVAAIPRGVVKVGLFVNSPAEEVCRLFDDLRLDLIQLHGDEPPEFLTQLGNRPVMRAFRVEPGQVDAMVEYLRRCGERKAMPAFVLLDAFVPGAYGGTGETGSWNVAQQYQAAMEGGSPIVANTKIGTAPLPPLVLAGGLTPQNVAEAIRTVHPTAVDVASGVESQPGRKDPTLVEAFVRAAQAAFLSD